MSTRPDKNSIDYYYYKWEPFYTKNKKIDNIIINPAINARENYKKCMSEGKNEEFCLPGIIVGMRPDSLILLGFSLKKTKEICEKYTILGKIYPKKKVYDILCDYIKYNGFENMFNKDELIAEGLTGEEIRQILPESEPEHEECPICYQNMITDKVITNCGHVFHEQCINNWINTRNRSGKNSECPLCRTKLTTLTQSGARGGRRLRTTTRRIIRKRSYKHKRVKRKTKRRRC